jgi:hypothetical protein
MDVNPVTDIDRLALCSDHRHGDFTTVTVQLDNGMAGGLVDELDDLPCCANTHDYLFGSVSDIQS